MANSWTGPAQAARAGAAGSGAASADEAAVCILGGGAVGMAAALALGRLGLGVALVQPVPAAPAPVAEADAGADPRTPDVRSYAINAASRTLLQSLKVWDALPADAVTAVEDMVVHGDAAGARLDFSAWQQGREALAWIVDAAALDEALRLALRFAPHVHRVDQAPTACALTVLAEGKDSATRAALGIGFERQPYGQTALATRLESDQAHGQTAQQWFGAPDVLALLPIDRPRAGHGYGLVWSLPPARAAALARADAAAFEAELAAATGGAAGTLRLAGPRQTWPLAIGRAQRLSGDGWVLAGDAAHQVHPLAGQGLNLGLADVQALAEVLATREPWRPLGDERLLRRYERARAVPNEAMALLTDGLQRLFAHPGAAPRELRNRGLTLLNRLTPLKRLLAAQAIGG